MKKWLYLISIVVVVSLTTSYFLSRYLSPYLDNKRAEKYHREFVQNSKEALGKMKTGEASSIVDLEWHMKNGKVLPEEIGMTQESLNALKHSLLVKQAKELLAGWRNNEFWGDVEEFASKWFGPSGLVNYEEAGTTEMEIKQLVHKDRVLTAFALLNGAEGFEGDAEDLVLYLYKNKISYDELNVTPEKMASLVKESKISKAKNLVSQCRQGCERIDLVQLKMLFYHEGISYEEAGTSKIEVDTF